MLDPQLDAPARDALAQDDVRKRLFQEGAEPLSTTPEEHARVIDAEETKWSKIIKDAGISAQ